MALAAPGRDVARLRFGCMGWGYEEWCGPFYPSGTPAIEFLERYARAFDLTEVDSSFYRAPSPFLARRWASATPTDFRFTLKVLRDITHAPLSHAVGSEIAKFLEGIEPIRAAGKLGALVAQFPASFKRGTGSARLTEVLTGIPADYPLAVEFRHASWWDPGVLRELEGRKAALVWSVYPAVRPPYALTGSFVYARFVGDRALTQFDRIQRDYTDEFATMRRHLEDEGRSAEEAYLLVNNHFMGYGPGSVVKAQEAFDVPPSDLTRAAREPGQQRLTG